MLPVYRGKKIEVDCLENLSPVEKETDDHDDEYEDYHIPVKIEAFHHVTTMCNNSLYDLRRANSVRHVIGVAHIGDIDPRIRVRNIVRID